MKIAYWLPRFRVYISVCPFQMSIKGSASYNKLNIFQALSGNYLIMTRRIWLKYATEYAKWQPAKSLWASLRPGPGIGSRVHADQNFHTISWPSSQTNWGAAPGELQLTKKVKIGSLTKKKEQEKHEIGLVHKTYQLFLQAGGIASNRAETQSTQFGVLADNPLGQFAEW